MSDTDAAGVVYFANFFNFAHEAFENWLTSQDTSIASILAKQEYILPVTKAEANFLAPLKIGDRIEINLVTSKPSDSVLVVDFEIKNLATNAIVAKLKHEHTYTTKQFR